MKDGRTRLAHKLEVGVDMESGAVAGVTVQTMDGGDTASLPVTLDETERRLAEAGAEPKEVVGDKGYHSNATMTGVSERGLRSYVSEPNRGRRKWKGKRDAQKATYGNHRRIRGERGKRLLRQRGEKLERTFAHLLVSGGLRRVHVRGQEEIRKRMLLHTAAFNLGLVMRKRFGFGTPRGMQGLAAAAAALADASVRNFAAFLGQIGRILGLLSPNRGCPRPSGHLLHKEHRVHAALVVDTTGPLASHFFHGLLVRPAAHPDGLSHLGQPDSMAFSHHRPVTIDHEHPRSPFHQSMFALPIGGGLHGTDSNVPAFVPRIPRHGGRSTR